MLLMTRTDRERAILEDGETWCASRKAACMSQPKLLQFQREKAKVGSKQMARQELERSPIQSLASSRVV
ncbi:hypothetical protein DdX_14262 [Ditylenchus destructor]|uniref:Uncharacterized protein n=1 Tax=Ditylenchus destructor TaxID=166010 RepID=A0AAD4QVR4_9BILA|nr:hypothetical protein DdX_14262 [Ditylenchus destructor]